MSEKQLVEDAYCSTALSEYGLLLQNLMTDFQNYFPECQAIRNFKLCFESGKSVDGFVYSIAKRHFQHLETPLPPSVSYCSALNRLKANRNCSHALYYDAYLYDDIAVIIAAKDSLVMTIGLDEKWQELDAESKGGFFDYMRAINDEVYNVMKEPPPVAFSRDDITDEIKGHRSDTDVESSSLVTVFGCVVRELVTIVRPQMVVRDCRGGLDTSDEAFGAHVDQLLGSPRDIMTQWHSVMSMLVPEGVSFYDACAKRDWASFAMIDEVDAEWALKSVQFQRGMPAPEVWEKLAQANALCRFQVSTPVHMLQVIESKVARVAEPISRGELDIRSLEVMAIVNEIVSECTESELKVFSEMLHAELVPLVRAFCCIPGGGGNGELVDSLVGFAGLSDIAGLAEIVGLAGLAPHQA